MLAARKFETLYMVLQVGLNFADVFTTLGLYAAAPAKDVVPGLEVTNQTFQRLFLSLMHFYQTRNVA